ncbi:MAG: 6-phosphogluconolactonase [Acidobacteriia bacterium]|nr:6-phosphogluconolactonase [Terriglobia bacterium]MBV8904440.1 6-phosphogluconolactonase [Terriglobia bacterium]
MSPRTHVLPDRNAAVEACAGRIFELLNESLTGREFATLAVSGGHIQDLFEKMAARRFDWKRLQLFWVDERCVPPHDSASNYKLAKDHLISRVEIPESHVHRIVGEVAPQEAAERYAQEIRSFFGLARGEMPAFDVVQCGMGPDGHTASLFPGDPMIDDREGIAAARFAPQQANQWRVTLLPGPLLAAHQRIYFVSGADKAPVLREVLNAGPQASKYPAGIVGRNAEWFVDREAADELESS